MRTRRALRSIIGAVTTAACLVLLSGCLAVPAAGSLGGGASRGLVLDASELTLPVCDADIRVEVESLTAEPDCRLEQHLTLVFPDGTELDVSPNTGAANQWDTASRRHWAYAAVGDYGAAAATFTDDCHDYVEWGRPDALRKLEDAFGAHHAWACD
ncbi:hypothetical protein [Schumannella soli]|uniref:Uncharacterized protein n=1 Tax=Schumannella soli TaxID=2590779 RepID=A0A506Y776_9MICO|nr:hypothetical protein [Schumannella soli]TPW77875.1 hypothetical protein FJ657_04305 [Schumannella soli]